MSRFQRDRKEASVKWNRLDNAAKIFPPTSTKRDTKVFHFACELTEPINESSLQLALDKAMEDFPFYRSVMKKGLFWYYLEESTLKPIVKKENAPLCSAIFDENIRGLLFEVTYYHNRINLEIYHSLSDGTGALQFLKALVYHYLLLRHSKELNDVSFSYDASFFQKSDDSFHKYYKKGKYPQRKPRRAFHLKGFKVAENRIKLIEGIMPVKEVIARAHEYDATLTTFLISVLMCSIADVMSVGDKKLPVVVSVPVNLRKYFSSESARNFFSVFEVSYDFSSNSRELKDVISYVTDYFKAELTADRMGARMNALAAIEHNVFARAVPRSLKDIVLSIVNRIMNMGITAAFSNIGIVEIPQELQKFIKLFDIFASTERLQTCMCSYGEYLTISFTSAFESTEVQKNFFRTLTGMEIPVTIVTTPADDE